MLYVNCRISIYFWYQQDFSNDSGLGKGDLRWEGTEYRGELGEDFQAIFSTLTISVSGAFPSHFYGGEGEGSD